jgi:carbamoyltransferase
MDFSARVQTVQQEQNPLYYELLRKFDEKYGCPVIINTSFNVRGEPLVCTPEDAYRCFMRTNMDYLVMGNFLLEKKEQKPLDKEIDWLREFELD